MIRVTPSRLITLQCSQIGLTLLRTFTGALQISRTGNNSGQDFEHNGHRRPTQEHFRALSDPHTPFSCKILSPHIHDSVRPLGEPCRVNDSNSARYPASPPNAISSSARTTSIAATGSGAPRTARPRMM